MADSIIIIPTYNEAGNIVRIIEAIFQLPTAFDILVIDDASPDGTADLVRGIMEKFPSRVYMEERSGKLGLGTAYILGFQWALQRDYKLVFEMDADFSHHPEDLQKIYDATQSDPDYGMYVGSRYIKGGKVVNWPLMRILISFGASLYVRMILWLGVSDTTAGFVCYRRKVLSELNFNAIEFVGYAFQIEMKFAVQSLGYKIKEIPITFRDRTVGVSKMSTHIFREAFLGVWKMRFKSFSNPYRNSV